MTTEVDANVRPSKPIPNFRLPEFLRKYTPDNNYAEYQADVLMRRIGLCIHEICDSDTAPWVAREIQRHFWRPLGLPKPSRPLDGHLETDTAESDSYWFTEPLDWPDDKPFKLRLEIEEMQSRLAAMNIEKPNTSTAVVQQSLGLLKKLLKMNNTEIAFTTAAWVISRSAYIDKHSPIATALRHCRFGYTGPNETNERYAPMLATLLDVPKIIVLDLIARMRDFVALNFVEADAWHDEAHNLFELLLLKTEFVDILENPDQNEKELEKRILDSGNSTDDTMPHFERIEHIVSNYQGDLKTAYIYSTLTEPLPAAAIAALSNRLVDLDITAAHVEPLADILLFESVVMAARRSALNIRMISSRLRRYQFLKELYQSERG